MTEMADLVFQDQIIILIQCKIQFLLKVHGIELPLKLYKSNFGCFPKLYVYNTKRDKKYCYKNILGGDGINTGADNDIQLFTKTGIHLAGTPLK